MTKDAEPEKKQSFGLVKVEDLLPEEVSWEDMKQNLSELDISTPRIRFSSSDALFYMSDEDEGAKSFEGVILWWTKQNTYWSSGYDQDNIVPPECYSLDGKTGSKHGACASCEFNQFGSAPTGGKGKACRNQVKLYIQLDRKAIPMILLISPKNLRAFTGAFMVDVTQRGLAFWKVKARFTAFKEKRETYSRVKIEIIGTYKGDELTKLTEIRDFWLKPLQNEHFASREFVSNEDSSQSSSAETVSAGEEAVLETHEPATSTADAVKVTPKGKMKKPQYEDETASEDPPF